MADVKFFRCDKTGDIVYVLGGANITPMCCDHPMEELSAGSTDAATEKHVPVATREGDTLKARVGSVDHPMLEEHSILWIAVAGEDSFQIKYLKPGDEPAAEFHVPAGEKVTVYEYCNLHGLWKCEA